MLSVSWLLYNCRTRTVVQGVYICRHPAIPASGRDMGDEPSTPLGSQDLATVVTVPFEHVHGFFQIDQLGGHVGATVATVGLYSY